MQKILWLAAAGALGTVARAGLTTLVQRGLGLKFPWGTLGVNVLGCFLFGLVWAITEGRARLSPELRFVVLVGFMGAFTTFSSYAFDTGMLAQDSRMGAAIGNVVLQNAVGILCLLMGLSVGKAWSPSSTATAAMTETTPAATPEPDEG
jgi:fluoride exporter